MFIYLYIYIFEYFICLFYMPRYYSKKNNKRFTSRKNLSRKHKSNNKYLNKKYSNKKGGSLTASLAGSLKSLMPSLSIIKSDKFDKKKLEKYIYELSDLSIKDSFEFKKIIRKIKEKSMKEELINTKILSYRLLFILYNNGTIDKKNQDNKIVRKILKIINQLSKNKEVFGNDNILKQIKVNLRQIFSIEKTKEDEYPHLLKLYQFIDKLYNKKFKQTIESTTNTLVKTVESELNNEPYSLLKSPNNIDKEELQSLLQEIDIERRMDGIKQFLQEQEWKRLEERLAALKQPGGGRKRKYIKSKKNKKLLLV